MPGIDNETAENTVRAMEYYSGTGHNLIHWDGNADEKATQLILAVFDSHKAPIYQGEISRGLNFRSLREIKHTLNKKKGIWTEPGISSFSTQKSIAEECFAKPKYAPASSWGLVLTCHNNKTAFPFRHISMISWEEEVLSPGGLRNNGWRIDYSTLKIDREKQIVYVDIEEI